VLAPRAPGLGGLFDDLALGRRLRAERYDIAIDFHGGPRASLLTWLSGAPERIGYEVAARSWMYTRRIARPRELRPRHSVENQWDLLAPLGVAPPDRALFPMEMPVDDAVAAAVAGRLAEAGVAADDRLVVIHVSAGNPFRRWPAAHSSSWRCRSRWASAPTCPRNVGTVGARSGRTRDRQARAGLGDEARGPDPLLRRVLARRASRAARSRLALHRRRQRPLHVAAATGVAIVGLYGPTLPIRSAPWRAASWITESVDAGELPCRPCEQRVCVPGDFRCLTLIKPAHVFDAAERALAGTGRR
jgi:ADP-heptose:LPS heptosyltransferase